MEQNYSTIIEKKKNLTYAPIAIFILMCRIVHKISIHIASNCYSFNIPTCRILWL